MKLNHKQRLKPFWLSLLFKLFSLHLVGQTLGLRLRAQNSISPQVFKEDFSKNLKGLGKVELDPVLQWITNNEGSFSDQELLKMMTAFPDVISGEKFGLNGKDVELEGSRVEIQTDVYKIENVFPYNSSQISEKEKLRSSFDEIISVLRGLNPDKGMTISLADRFQLEIFLELIKQFSAESADRDRELIKELLDITRQQYQKYSAVRYFEDNIPQVSKVISDFSEEKSESEIKTQLQSLMDGFLEHIKRTAEAENKPSGNKETELQRLESLKSDKALLYKLLNLKRRKLVGESAGAFSGIFSALESNLKNISAQGNASYRVEREIDQFRTSLGGLLRIELEENARKKSKDISGYILAGLLANYVNKLERILWRNLFKNKIENEKVLENVVKVKIFSQYILDDVLLQSKPHDQTQFDANLGELNKSLLNISDYVNQLLKEGSLEASGLASASELQETLARLQGLLDFFSTDYKKSLETNQPKNLQEEEKVLLDRYNTCFFLKSRLLGFDSFFYKKRSTNLYHLYERFFYQLLYFLGEAFHEKECTLESLLERFVKNTNLEKEKLENSELEESMRKFLQEIAQGKQIDGVIKSTLQGLRNITDQVIKDRGPFRTLFDNLTYFESESRDPFDKVKNFIYLLNHATNRLFQNKLSKGFVKYVMEFNFGLVEKYNHFFALFIDFAGNLEFWNLRHRSVVMIYKIFYKFYLNVRKLIKSLSKALPYETESFKRLYAIQSDLYDYLNLKLDRDLMQKYVRNKPIEFEESDNNWEEHQYFSELLFDSYVNITRAFGNNKDKINKKNYYEMYNIKYKIIHIIDLSNSLRNTDYNRSGSEKTREIEEYINNVREKLLALLAKPKLDKIHNDFKNLLEILNSFELFLMPNTRLVTRMDSKTIHYTYVKDLITKRNMTFIDQPEDFILSTHGLDSPLKPTIVLASTSS